MVNRETVVYLAPSFLPSVLQGRTIYRKLAGKGFLAKPKRMRIISTPNDQGITLLFIGSLFNSSKGWEIVTTP